MLIYKVKLYVNYRKYLQFSYLKPFTRLSDCFWGMNLTSAYSHSTVQIYEKINNLQLFESINVK